VIFAQAIPPFARKHLRPGHGRHAGEPGPRVGDVDRFICHPGGMKVIEALEASLELGQGALDHEREVWPTTATCRRPPCCTSSTARAAAACHRARSSPRLVRLHRQHGHLRPHDRSVTLLASSPPSGLGELVLARANTARLKARGGVEHAAGHYPLIVALHAAWLGGLWSWPGRPVHPCG
jgi:hypothetical protein